MTNIYVRGTALTNVCGRENYISSEKKQENLVAVYSTVDKEFWSALSLHCQKAAAEAGHKTVCEGREWHAALPNQYAEMYAGREEELAKELSDLIKNITGTENSTALHWNKSKTNFHVHFVCAENPEINEVTYGAVLTRDTYYDAEGKRSTKKCCVNPETKELLPGCELLRKGEQKITVKRFGAKVDLHDKAVTEKVKQALVDKFNHDLQTDQFRTFQDTGLHLRQQHIGKNLPQEIKEAVEEKNAVVREYNKALETYWAVSLENGTEANLEAQRHMKNLRMEIKAHAMSNEWLLAIQKSTEWIKAAITKPFAKEKPYYPESIMAALREVCRQSDAFYDKRRPANSAVMEAPGKLQFALEQLEPTFIRWRSAQNKVSTNKWPWQKELRTAAIEDAAKHHQELSKLYSIILDAGIAAYHDGVQMRVENLEHDDIEYIKLCGERKVSDLQRKANYEIQHARPANAMDGSEEKLRDAQERLQNLLQNVPDKEKDTLLDRMIRFVKEYQTPNGSLDAMIARGNLEENLRSKMREPDVFGTIASTLDKDFQIAFGKTCDNLKNQAEYKKLLKKMDEPER